MTKTSNTASEEIRGETGEETLLREALQRAYAVPASSEQLQERLMALAAAQKPPPLQGRPVVSGRVVSRRVVLGAATVAVAGIAASLLLPGTPTRPDVAFAQVEEALNNVRSATWTEAIETSLPDQTDERKQGSAYDISQAKTTSKEEVWVQLDPPRMAVRSLITDSVTPAKNMRTVSDGRHTITMMFFAEPHQYIRSDFQTRAGSDETPGKRIRSALLFPRDESRRDVHQQTLGLLPHIPTKQKLFRSEWKSSEERLDGRRVIRFESTATRVYMASKWTPQRGSTPETRRRREEWTIWVEPDTYRIVRREVRNIPESRREVEWRRISADFHYNITPPEGIFEVPIPPVGKPFQFMDLSEEAANVSRTLLSSADTEAVRRMIRRAVDAWNRRDQAAFAALWDFEDMPQRARWMREEAGQRDAATMTATDWRGLWLNSVKRGIPYHTWEAREIGRPVRHIARLFVRKAESDAFPPRLSIESYGVTVTSRVRLSPGAAPTLCDTTFHFRKEGNTFRIVNLYQFTRFPPYLARPSGTRTRPAGRR